MSTQQHPQGTSITLPVGPAREGLSLSAREGLTRDVGTCFVALLFRYTSLEDIELSFEIVSHATSSGSSASIGEHAWRVTSSASFADLQRQSLELARRVTASLSTATKLQLIASADLQLELGNTINTTVPVGDRLILTLFFEATRAFLSCSSATVDQRTVLQMAGHLGMLLEAMSADENQQVLDVPLVAAAEWRELQQQSSGVARIYPEKSLTELLLQQADRAPEATALILGNETITRRQLNQRSNQLAHYLKSLPLQPGEVVAICAADPVRVIECILGVLKAGGIYMVLDVHQPTERLRSLLRETNPSVGLTAGEFIDALRSESRTRILDLNEQQPDIARRPTTNVSVTANAKRACYLTYTSGSTGRPLGILGVESSILNGLNETLFDPQRTDEVCCIAGSLALGFQTLGLFLPLLCGVPLVLLSSAEYREPLALAAAIEKYRITTIVLPTPVFRQLLSFGQRMAPSLSSLRTIQIGGTTVTPDLVAKTASLLPRVELRNAWGFTELGGMATSGRATADRSVGRPVTNTRVYVLDHNLKPAPRGAIGELCVAASHLASEYFRQPELTALRFRVDPFQSGNVPLYRTGDLGRFNWEGKVEFLGRRDHQVKVRGFRVQLGEIEAVLLGHPDMIDTAVILDQSASEGRLVAHMVRKPESRVDSATMRTYLSERLPHYMVPAAFVFQESLPKTEGGKVDRIALSALPVPQTVSSEKIAQPGDDIEELLQRIWSQILGIGMIDVHHHFLELGGDSMLAVQIVARIWEETGIELSGHSLFVNPTVAELAGVLRQKRIAASSE